MGNAPLMSFGVLPGAHLLIYYLVFLPGPLAEVNMPVDKILRQPKGFATVTFVMPEHAVKAFTELDGTAFCGRMLHLLPAKTEKLEDADDDGNTTKIVCWSFGS